MTTRTLFLLLSLLTGTCAVPQEPVPDTHHIPDIGHVPWYQDTTVYIVMEVMPSFPGGAEAMHKYIAEQVTLPKEAADTGIQGVVHLNFVVEKDGTLSNAKVLRGIGGGCDEEALRMLERMPTWEPGTDQGKPKRAYVNLPVHFRPKH